MKEKLEFSKKLTIIDIVAWIFLSLCILILLLVRPELGAFIQSIFAYITTAYVSLRLGYTAKAGVENYKKIAQTYKEVTSLNSAGNYKQTSTGYSAFLKLHDDTYETCNCHFMNA